MRRIPPVETRPRLDANNAVYSTSHRPLALLAAFVILFASQLLAFPVSASTTIPYTFNNYCSQDIWIGEHITGQQNVQPADQSWKLAAMQATTPGTKTFNVPNPWTSGTFWGRTGCSGSGDNLRCATGECQMQKTTVNVTKGTQTVDAIYPENCGYRDTVTKYECASGSTTCTPAGSSCNKGSTDCDEIQIIYTGGTPQQPVTLAEMTTTTGQVNKTTPVINGVIGNFDVSLVSGYNLEMKVIPQVVDPNTQAAVTSCTSGGCDGELLDSCPTKLQLTDGAGTVIACNTPFNACATAPGCTQDSDCGSGTTGVCNTGLTNPVCEIGLDCNTIIGTASGSTTYNDMYAVKNTDPSSSGDSMASSNQGTPTCFSNSDCPPASDGTFSQVCSVTLDQSKVTGLPTDLPSGAGVCLDATSPDFKWTPAGGSSTSCNGNAGNQCGGYDGLYSDALNYTCTQVTVNTGTTKAPNNVVYNPCLPPTTNGLGTLTSPSSGSGDLYNGVGGLFNPAWMTASALAGDTSVPYYKNFKTACEKAYTWQYDDPSGGIGTGPGIWCAQASNELTGFTIEFCPSKKPATTVVIPANRDAFVDQGKPNGNAGANPVLRVGAAKHTLLGFDLQPGYSSGLQKAYLMLSTESPRSDPEKIRIHRLDQHFPDEGNGLSSRNPGSNSGVTWNCAEDANIADRMSDCAQTWQGGLMGATANPTGQPVSSTRVGDERIFVVKWNVTDDVRQALENGDKHIQWLARLQSTRRFAPDQRFISREGAIDMVDIDRAPTLILEHSPDR